MPTELTTSACLAQALMTQRVKPEEQGALQGALGSIRGISMLIGPGLFTAVFAQFVGPWRSAGVPGAPWYLSACLYGFALAVAWRATRSRPQAAAIGSQEPAGA